MEIAQAGAEGTDALCSGCVSAREAGVLCTACGAEHKPVTVVKPPKSISLKQADKNLASFIGFAAAGLLLFKVYRDTEGISLAYVGVAALVWWSIAYVLGRMTLIIRPLRWIMANAVIVIILALVGLAALLVFKPI